jgi:tyrosyl-tRNA synthetase
MEEVKTLAALDGTLINRAKEILAYEATAITHGPELARTAYLTSINTFGQADPSGRVETSSGIIEIEADVSVEIPQTGIPADELEAGRTAASLFLLAGLAKTKGEARRLIRGGGAYINDQRVASEDQVITSTDLKDKALILRAGKKRYHRLFVQD